jgi:hypothetical protein
MSGKAKFLVFLLAGGGVVYGFHQKAGTTWAASGSYPVAKKARGGLLKVGDAHALKLTLDAPASEKRFREVEVPEEVFDRTEPGDTFVWSMRTVRPLKLEAVDYRIDRAGKTVQEWDEGYVFYWGGVLGAGLVVGILAMAVLTLIGMALGMGKIVKE